MLIVHNAFKGGFRLVPSRNTGCERDVCHALNPCRSFNSDSSGNPLMMMFIVKIRCSFKSSLAWAFFLASAASEIARCSTSTSLFRESTGTERQQRTVQTSAHWEW